jgi:hypothetical protein
VSLIGLKAKPELNSSKGFVTSFDQERGRYKILLDDGQTLAVRLQNLVIQQHFCTSPRNGSLFPLPEFCIGLLCEFLHPADLLTTGNISAMWKAESDRDEVWQKHCLRDWDGRLGLLCIPEATTIDDFLSKLKIKELKRLLQIAGVSMAGFRERQEFVSALRAKRLCPSKKIMSEWLLRVPSWKASFFFMRQDCTRTHISTAELCNEQRLWTWNFNPDSNMAHMTIQSEFSPDGSYTSSHEDTRGHERQKTWTFMDGVIGGTGSLVQVGEYPRLKVSRNAKTWGWMMHNEYGYFTEKMKTESAEGVADSTTQSQNTEL